jgi:hypothetical protein
MEPGGGTTNIRNVKSWTRCLGPGHRCAVSFNSFSQFNKAEGGELWFALGVTRPLACDLGPKGQGRRDYQRRLRFPDD